MNSPDSPEKTSPDGSEVPGSDGIPSLLSPLRESIDCEPFRASCELLGSILHRVPDSVIHSFVKKEDRAAVAFIFMRFVSILSVASITLSESGKEFTVSLEVGSMMPKEEPPTM